MMWEKILSHACCLDLGVVGHFITLVQNQTEISQQLLDKLVLLVLLLNPLHEDKCHCLSLFNVFCVSEPKREATTFTTGCCGHSNPPQVQLKKPETLVHH